MQADHSNNGIAPKPLILGLIAEGFVLALIIAFPSAVIAFVRRSPVLDVSVPIVLGSAVALAARAVFGKTTQIQSSERVSLVPGIIGMEIRRRDLIVAAAAGLANLLFLYLFLRYWTAQ